ncbi:hypothetical protein PNK_2369 [Candidatus Protochlamydia naegleriophila]|uniref:Uncharacterized protein n=1 Tax=Candidatus Protochlamydia naegleriophila TaxID=389348 RepID=A0A0U5JFT7_9BACT|nr:DUF2490 domain-containing protein [Candidatus Protochlamydia naegleriophila]CUI17965.1 hypothetical protein PNK_2369 [Candidatus Protochlamydia naegleriophila]
MASLRKQFSFWLAALSLLPCHAAFPANWDIEYWQSLRWTHWTCAHTTLYTTGEVRLNRGCSSPCYYRLTGNLARRIRPFLDAEAHFSFIYNKSRGSPHFTNTQRLELEINPKISFNSGINLKCRNRLELIKKQQSVQIQTVLRHKISLTFPIQGCGRLNTLTCSEEFYYDLNTHLFTQSRFFPLELNYAVTPNTSLNVYCMIRHFLSNDKWYRSLVLGTEFNF